MDVQFDLVSQVQKLRKDIFLTRCVLGLAMLCLTALTIANWRRHPKTIEANEFLLRGQSGNIAARLGQESFGDTCLTLMAKGKVAVASMCVQDEEGSSLDLHNLKSESRATLTPGFHTYEPAMQIRPALVINGVNYSAGNK
jgi:hypothetical protein